MADSSNYDAKRRAIGDPGYVARRQQEELERALADTQWLRERGIVPGRQPLARAAGAETYMGPTGDPTKAPGADWRSMPWHERAWEAMFGSPKSKETEREFFKDLPEHYAREYRKQMPLGDIPIRDKKGKVVEWVPREEWERRMSPLSPTEEAAADPFLAALELLAGSKGGGAAEGRIFFGSPADRHAFAELLNDFRNIMKGPDNPLKRGLLKTLGKGVAYAEKPSPKLTEAAKQTLGNRPMSGYYTRAGEPILTRTTPRSTKEIEHYLKKLEEGGLTEIYAPGAKAKKHELTGHGAFAGLEPATKAQVSRAGVRSPHQSATYTPVGEETFAYTMADIMSRQPGMAPKEMEDLIRFLGKLEY